VRDASLFPWVRPGAWPQEQTVKGVPEPKWQAHKADNQAKGVTEKGVYY